MTDLKICRICLRTEAKVYKFSQFQLQSYYEEVTALKLSSNDSLPQCFCYECAMMLHKFHRFKEKCYVGQKILKEILWKGPISYQSVYQVDRVSKNLQSPVGPMTVTENVKSFFMIQLEDEKKPAIKKEEQIKINKRTTKNDKIDEDNDYFDLNDSENVIEEPESPTAIFIDDKNGTIKLETEQIKDGKKSPNVFLDEKSNSKVTIGSRRTRYLDANNWKLTNLSEDEALKQFRGKCEDGRYKKAAYKCTSCFKGFSKSDMLHRHNELRHNESLGTFECRFCRMRFKFDSHLRIHMRHHFTKYHCLRCDFLCDLENTALLHEEYHSGTKKKCIQCGEEFRHASTFYTHMRTRHRSAHVCVLCGVSCVSAAGLIQHLATTHRTHAADSQSDDDEEVTTYCERCDINFDTTKAFVEHFFHSIQHSEGVEHEIKDEITIPRKVMGKKLKAKVSRQIRKRTPDEPPFIIKESKKKKKSKRDRRKPSTCHQCGLHFPTQSACMKHHVAAHPRTSFYADQLRHVCEICGASLAPGSVATHRNMHTRAVTHACDICHKLFHSSVSYKRHLVTHTGEKKFACTLCDKRFTQSNSMKLHYKTFHLKQPYPKRNRRKNKEPTSEPSECGSGAEGPSLPVLPPCPPAVAAPGPGPAPHLDMGEEEHDSVQYLTLR